MRLLRFNKTIDEIPFDQAEFFRLMGFGEALPDPFEEAYQKVSMLFKAGTARAEAIIFEGDEVEIKRNSIVICEVEFYTGSTVARCLRSCSGAALFICTLGAEFEEMMNSFDDDPVAAYFANTLGSLQCEAFAEAVQGHITAQVHKEGLSTTNRYSPGYCNWSVGEQQKLFPFFKENQTGITLNESSLMSPIKSISGVMGIGAGVKSIPYKCGSCNDMKCLYRKTKTKM